MVTHNTLCRVHLGKVLNKPTAMTLLKKCLKNIKSHSTSAHQFMSYHLPCACIYIPRVQTVYRVSSLLINFRCIKI